MSRISKANTGQDIRRNTQFPDIISTQNISVDTENVAQQITSIARDGVIYLSSSGTIAVGSKDVTMANGYLLTESPLPLALSDLSNLYFISESTSDVLNCLITYNRLTDKID